MNALQKIPVALQKQLAHASLQIQNNAAKIYDLLDRKSCPVKVEQIENELKLGAGECRTARKLLMTIDAGVYVTQDGIVLKKYLTKEELRYWHLAWSLGLLEVSGRQLTLDEDLLEKIPEAVYKLKSQGKLMEKKRVEALRIRARQAVAILMQVADMYRQVDKALGFALLPEISGTEWKTTLSEIRKQLKTLN